jgi:hypothetical protein
MLALLLFQTIFLKKYILLIRVKKLFIVPDCLHFRCCNHRANGSQLNTSQVARVFEVNSTSQVARVF